MSRRSASGFGRRALLVLLPCLAATGPVTAHASEPLIQPKQHFTATVNGGTGRTQPVAIRMACFGPIHPGQTGHPMSGQAVAVRRTSSSSGSGYTGDHDSSVGAFFGAPPPGAAAPDSYVLFRRYGSKSIPTSLELPCAGSGMVSFVPLPLDPTSRDVTVPVTFVGQP